MTSSRLEALPPELLVHLVSLLNLEDCMSLRCVSKPLRNLLKDEGLCELMTEVTYPFSPIEIHINKESSSTSHTPLKQRIQRRTSSITQMPL